MNSKEARIPIASDVFSLGAVFYFLYLIINVESLEKCYLVEVMEIRFFIKIGNVQ